MVKNNCLFLITLKCTFLSSSVALLPILVKAILTKAMKMRGIIQIHLKCSKAAKTLRVAF